DCQRDQSGADALGGLSRAVTRTHVAGAQGGGMAPRRRRLRAGGAGFGRRTAPASDRRIVADRARGRSERRRGDGAGRTSRLWGAGGAHVELDGAAGAVQPQRSPGTGAVRRYRSRTHGAAQQARGSGRRSALVCGDGMGFPVGACAAERGGRRTPASCRRCGLSMYRGRFIPASDGSLPAAVQPTELTADEADARRAGGRRIACVLIADFPIAALVRTNPEWRERPLALTRQARPRPARGGTAATSSKEPAGQWTPYGELSHVAPVAAAMGVRAGMTIAQGRALLPELIVTHPSPAAEEAARAALTDVAWSFSPVIEERAPGCVWIDLSGTEGLYRQEPYAAATALEQRIAEAIARRVRGIRLEAAVGIASSKELAYLAARCGGLPDWLKRMGLRRLGDLARLDPHAVGTRMGAAGVALARLARGEGSALVRARPRPEDFTEALELEYGIEQLEALTFLLRAMLDRLCARLALRGLAVGGLTLGLGLADGGRDERRITAAAPTTESAALLTLLRLNLEARGPAAAVETLRLTAEARQPRPLVNDLFQPPAPAADRLGVVI